MPVRRWLLVGMVACGLLLLAGGSAAGARQSPNGAADCWGAGGYTYNLCLWRDGDYGGPIWNYNEPTNGHNVWEYVGSAANDQASSIANDRQHVSYVGVDYPVGSSEIACLPQDWATNHSYYVYFMYPTPYGSTMFDNISAYDLLGSETTCPADKLPG